METGLGKYKKICFKSPIGKQSVGILHEEGWIMQVTDARKRTKKGRTNGQ